jgi:hypothetical protein
MESFTHKKDDCMKKLFIVIIFTLLLVGCQRKEVDTKSDLISNDLTSVTNNDDYSDSQNDLVYRDYGTGIKLSSNSKLIISQLDLSLKDETAIIYAINLENREVIKLYDYQPNQDISYTPDSDGVYNIVAELSNGETIDLTQKAMVETTYTEENGSGLIPLK